MIKKLLSLIAVLGIGLFSAQTAFSETLYVINTGSENGSASVRMQAYYDDLKNYYDDIEYIHLKGCSKSSNVVPKIDGPTIWYYFGPWYNDYKAGLKPNCNTEITEKNYIRSDAFFHNIVVKSDSKLTINDFLTPGRTYKVGVETPEINTFIVESLGKSIGVNLKPVYYKNSRGVLQGILSGEIDFGYTFDGAAQKFKNDGHYKVLGSTNPNSVDSIFLGSVIEDFISLPGLSFYLIDNVTDEERSEILKVLNEIHNNVNSEIYNHYKTRNLVLPQINYPKYSYISESVDNWIPVIKDYHKKND